MAKAKEVLCLEPILISNIKIQEATSQQNNSQFISIDIIKISLTTQSYKLFTSTKTHPIITQNAATGLDGRFWIP